MLKRVTIEPATGRNVYANSKGILTAPVATAVATFDGHTINFPVNLKAEGVIIGGKLASGPKSPDAVTTDVPMPPQVTFTPEAEAKVLQAIGEAIQAWPEVERATAAAYAQMASWRPQGTSKATGVAGLNLTGLLKAKSEPAEVEPTETEAEASPEAEAEAGQ